MVSHCFNLHSHHYYDAEHLSCFFAICVFSYGKCFASSSIGFFFFLICRNSSNALGINLLPIVYFAYIFYVLALPVVTKLYYPMQKAADLRD